MQSWWSEKNLILIKKDFWVCLQQEYDFEFIYKSETAINMQLFPIRTFAFMITFSMK